MTTLGERLKNIRWVLKLNQKQMAEKLELTQSAISAVEKGISKSLSGDNLAKLLIEFNVNINWLLSGEGEMFNSENKNDLDKKVEQKVAEAFKKYGLTDK
jgi:transcriptional regulator with XRE-family HTH domain